MEETTLRNTAFFCSITGLILLFFVSNTMQTTLDISSITIDDVGKSVTICGTISSRRVYNNHIFMNIEDRGEGVIRFVIFNTTALKLNQTGTNPYKLKEGLEICAPGVVKEYPKGSGELELVYKKGDIIIT